MPVDTSKIRPGDVVHVRCIVVDTPPHRQVVKFKTCEPHPDLFSAAEDCIVHVETRPIGVGDLVEFIKADSLDGPGAREVVAIVDRWAWVKIVGRNAGWSEIADLSDLQLADPAS